MERPSEQPEQNPPPSTQGTPPEVLGYEGAIEQRKDLPLPDYLHFAVVAAITLAFGLVMIGCIGLVGFYLVGFLAGFVASLVAILCGGAMLAFHFAFRSGHRRAFAIANGTLALLLSLPLAWVFKELLVARSAHAYAVMIGVLMATAIFCAAAYLCWALRTGPSRSRDPRV